MWSRQRIVRVAGLLLVAASGCGEGPGAPETPASIAFSLHFDGNAAALTLTEAFASADNLLVRVEIAGGSTVEEVFPVVPGQQEIRAQLELDLTGGDVAAVVTVQLRLGPAVLFTGTQTADFSGGGQFVLEIPIAPEPAQLELDGPVTVETLGTPVQLTGTAFFATGDEIGGDPIVWSTGASGIDVTPDGLLTAFQNGTFQVTGTAGSLSGSVQVLANTEASVTSISPETVLLGHRTVLQLDGENLFGASAVTVCGTALVENQELSVDATGTRITVPVTWDVVASGGSSSAVPPPPQVGSQCVDVATPQGSSGGSVTLVEPAATAVSVSPSQADLEIGQTVQLDIVVQDDIGTVLSHAQLTLSSDQPSVASVDVDGLVTAHSEGTAVILAEAGTGSGTATIRVGSGGVVGTVTAGGDPLAGVTVTLDGSVSTTTAADGTYGFSNVAPGDHTVEISDLPSGIDFPTTSQQVSVVPGVTSVVDFSGVFEPSSISGTVTADGGPLAGVVVQLSGGDGTQTLATAPDGSYAFTGLSPGGYSVSLPSPPPGVTFTLTSTTVSLAPGVMATVDFTGTALPAILFEGDADSSTEIWRTDVLGTGPTRLTSNADFDGRGRVSPDGMTIAFHRIVGFGSIDIAVMNTDGSGQTVLGPSGFADDLRPRWSPDGMTIAFLSDMTGGTQVHTMNPDGTGVSAALTSSSGDVTELEWSPDGTRIVYVDDANIWVMDPDGSNKLQLTTSGSDFHPDWSPDGTEIVFSRDGGGESDILKIPASGGTAVSLTSGSSDDTEPRWSPGGTSIAFVRSTTPGTGEIYRIGASGGSPTPLTTLGFDSRSPEWSPDSGTLVLYAFEVGGGGDGEIFVVQADGTGLMQLTNNTTDDTRPHWFPGS